jgi:hypothetical protein
VTLFRESPYKNIDDAIQSSGKERANKNKKRYDVKKLTEGKKKFRVERSICDEVK